MDGRERETLDQWLEAAPLAQPSAWFEARVLAKIRQEKQESKGLASWVDWFLQKKKWMPYAGGLVCAGLLGITAITTHEVEPQLSDKEVFDSLSAFKSYEEDVDNWYVEDAEL